MLFNEKWSESKVTPQTDILSTESLIRWLEKRPRSRRYDYCNARHCLLCQYLRDSGIPLAGVGAGYYRVFPSGSVQIPLPDGWDRIAGDFHGTSKWTFGDALDRAKALLRKGK